MAARVAAIAVGVLGLGAAGQFEVLDVGGSAVPQAGAPTRLGLDAPNANCPGVVGIGPLGQLASRAGVERSIPSKVERCDAPRIH